MALVLWGVALAAVAQTPGYVPPRVTGISPANGAIEVLPNAAIRATIEPGDSTPVPGSVRMLFNGVEVTTDLRVTVSGSSVTVVYQPDLLAQQQHCEVALTFGDDRVPSFVQTHRWAFTVLDATVVRKERRLPAAPDVAGGFRLRSVQVGPGGSLVDSIQAAESLLSLTPTPPVAYRAYRELPVLNLGTGDASSAGEFHEGTGRPDTIWREAGLTTNSAPFAVECQGYLELPAGRVRLGAISDDGFRLRLLPTAAAPLPLLLGESFGAEDGERQFDLFVEEAGFYPYRLVHWNVGGPSYFEFFTVPRVSEAENRVLVNDLSAPNALRAYVMPPALQAPVILTEPQDRLAFVGDTFSLETIAEPDGALTYQWLLNGRAVVDDGRVSGSRSAKLVVQNAQLSHAGNYTLRISNALGTLTSRTAVVRITTPPSCPGFMPGLLAWWSGEGSALDSVSRTLAALPGGMTYVPGRLGRAFSFDGLDDAVLPPSTNLYVFAGDSAFSAGAWVRPDLVTGVQAVLAKAGPVDDARPDYGLYLVDGFFVVRRGRETVAASPTPVVARVWYHVAMTYDRGRWVLYVNGQADAAAEAEPVVPSIGRLALGQLGDWGRDRFRGVVDEAFVFRRALEPGEVEVLRTMTDIPRCDGSNGSPTVALVAPTNGTVVTTLSSVRLAASARDPNGTVARVEFFRGDVSLGSSRTSPYELQWTNPPAGLYALTARAVDNWGLQATSAPVTLRVVDAPLVTVEDVAVREGDSGTTNAIFRVRLSAAIPIPVDIGYTTRDNTALQGSDYNGGAGVLRIPAGETSRALAAAVRGDRDIEDDETFFLVLTSATDAVLGRDRATATIVNDDLPNEGPTVAWKSPTDGTVAVAAGPLRLEADAVDPDGGIVRVEFLNAGVKIGEAVAPPYAWDWMATPGTHVLSARAVDTAGASATTAPVTVTVLEAPVLGVEDVSVREGNAGTSDAVFVLRLSRAAPLPVSVRYATADGTARGGTDYDGALGTVLFEGDQVERTVRVGVRGDVEVESDETFFLVLTNTLNAVLGRGRATATIVNDDVPNAPPTVAWKEPAAGAVLLAPGPLRLEVEAADPDGRVTRVEFLDGGTVVGEALAAPHAWVWTGVPAGVHVLTARAFDDADGVTLSEPLTVTVVEPPRLEVADVVVTEGDDGTTNAVFRLQLSAAIPLPVEVHYTTLDGSAVEGSDYTGGAGVLRIPAGETSRALAATVHGDRTVEDDEQFFLALTNVVNAVPVRDRASATILNDDVPNLPPTVAWKAPADGVVVLAPGPLRLEAEAADADGSVVRVEFLDGAVKLGEAPAAPYLWDWSAVPAGVHTLRVRAVDNRGAVTTSPPLTVTVAEAPVIDVADVVVKEGDAGVTHAGFVVRLSRPAPLPVTLRYATVDGTARSGTDYDGVAGTLSFATGEVERTVTVPVRGDREVEADESFVLEVTNPVNAGLGRGRATATILNDDVANQPPTVAWRAPAAGSVVLAPGPLRLEAEAADADGAVARVEFLDGTVKIGEVLAAPYAWEWGSVPAGVHVLSARAVDNAGAVATSAPVTVTVVAPPVADVSDASVKEGDTGSTNAVFLVRLSRPAPLPVTLRYLTADGTARSGTDYEGLSGTLRFAVGEVEQRVSVSVRGDREVEGDEWFSLVLTEPVQAVLGRDRASATILNDDEGNRPPTVSWKAPADGTVVLAPGPLRLEAEATDVDGTIARVEFFDGAVKLGEALVAPYAWNWAIVPAGPHVLSARAVDNAGAVSTSTAVTVNVVDTPMVEVPDVTVKEGDAGTTAIEFVVRLSPASPAPITLRYTTVDDTALAGSDYEAASGTLRFEAGETLKTFQVLARGDTTVEPDESFVVLLQNSGGAMPDRLWVVGRLDNDDAPPSLTPPADQVIDEGQTLSLRLLAVDPNVPVQTLTYALVNGPVGMTVTPAGQLTWATGEADGPGSQTVTVRVSDGEGTDQRDFRVTVREVNQPPRLAAVADRVLEKGQTLALNLVATDDDRPVQNLTFRRVNGPAGLTVSPQGTVAWTPGPLEPGGTYLVTVEVSDGLAAATTSFRVELRRDALPPRVALVSPTNGMLLAARRTVRVSVEAEDDGAVARVELLQVTGGVTNRLAEWLAPPYQADVPTGAEGILTLVARAVDDQGAVGVSAPVSATVRDLDGDILLVRNGAHPELDRLSELLTEISLPKDDGVGSRPAVVRVLDRGVLHFDLVTGFRLMVWDDLGNPDVAIRDTEVDLLTRAREWGIALYLIGDRLVGAGAGLTGRSWEQWQRLTGLASAPGVTPAAGVTRVEPVDRVNELFWGTHGFVDDFAYPRLPERVMNVDPEAEVRGRSGTADVLVRYPRFDRVDTFEARVLRQGFLVSAGTEAASLEERRKLFLNGVNWLLRLGECQNFAASPSCEEEVAAATAGVPLTLTLRITSNGRCPVSGVVVTNALPAAFMVESASFRSEPAGRAFGTATVRDGAVVYRFGAIDPGTDLVLETRVIPRWGGTFSSVFEVWVNYRRPESCLQTVQVTGSDCATPALGLALHADGIHLETRDRVDCDVVIEESADLLTWRFLRAVPAGTPAGDLGRIDPGPGGQRFYRLRRAP